MRRTPRRRGFMTALIILGAIVLIGRITSDVLRTPKPSGKQTLLVHCGNSMRPAAEEIAKAFQERHGTRIEFSYGGSEALLPQIITRREGDIFITHDPYGDLIEEKGLLADLATVGYLTPVIIVPKGNPHGIDGLDSVLKPGLRVGVTDPRYTTAGEMVEEKVRERTGKSYDDHPNFVLQARSHGDVATALVTGQLDAGIVWNFIGVQFGDRVDVIPIDARFPEIRVTVCRLKSARNIAAAKNFLDFASSEEGRKVFADYGYLRASE